MDSIEVKVTTTIKRWGFRVDSAGRAVTFLCGFASGSASTTFNFRTETLNRTLTGLTVTSAGAKQWQLLESGHNK